MQTPNTYDNERRYVFSNWSNEDFSCMWGGKTTTVKAGEILEVPEYLAYHFTKYLVDREMIKAGKEALIGDDNVRKSFEDKTVSLISAGTDSPALATLKEKIKQEIEEQAEKKPAKEKKEFAGIK